MRSSIDFFTSNVKLSPGESICVDSENVRIQSIEWYPDMEYEMDEDNIHLEAPTKEMFEKKDTSSTVSPTLTTPNRNTSITTAAPVHLNITGDTEFPDTSVSTRSPAEAELPVSIYSHLIFDLI